MTRLTSLVAVLFMSFSVHAQQDALRPFIPPDAETKLGTVFTGRLIEETTVGKYTAVVPTLGGQAWITGMATYVLDPDDPFPEGFRLPDTWGAGL